MPPSNEANRSRRALSAAGALLVVALAGCGGESDSTALDKPLFAKCGTKGFTKPRAVRVTEGGGGRNVWQVQYSIGPREGRRGQTSYVSILERPPAAEQPPIKGSRVVKVKGVDISLLTVKGGGTHYGGWTTGKARYLALSDGANPEALKRLAVCMP